MTADGPMQTYSASGWRAAIAAMQSMTRASKWLSRMSALSRRNLRLEFPLRVALGRSHTFLKCPVPVLKPSLMHWIQCFLVVTSNPSNPPSLLPPPIRPTDLPRPALESALKSGAVAEAQFNANSPQAARTFNMR
jgi:hypothetical protein